MSEADFLNRFGRLFRSRCLGGRAILFASHDPGSISHTHPIFAAAAEEGRGAVFVPLRDGTWPGPPKAKVRQTGGGRGGGPGGQLRK